jgi:hypothetical protein
MSCGRNMTRKGEGRNGYVSLITMPERKRPLGEFGVDGRIISSVCIFSRQVMTMWTSVIWMWFGFSGCGLF